MANNKTKAAVGGVLAAGAAAAAAGYYFYASKNAKQNRKVAAKWAVAMKNDVMKQAKKLQDMDKKQLLGVIDSAAAAYTSVKNVDRKDLDRAAKELKANWQEIVAEVQKVTKKKSSAKKSSAKKTTKKTR